MYTLAKYINKKIYMYFHANFLLSPFRQVNPLVKFIDNDETCHTSLFIYIMTNFLKIRFGYTK